MAAYNEGGSGVFILTTIVSALLKFISSALDGEIGEFCLTEHFNASCSGDDVIMMTSAYYGRMRIGRCIRGEFNIGCSNDVISYFDLHCSGRRSCEVSVRSLVDIRPCQRDFASYLEASYRCITVPGLQLKSCPPSNRIVMETTTGFLSNNLQPGSYSAAGRAACPWSVRGRPGQRVQLTLLSLQPTMVSESVHYCPRVVVVERRPNDLDLSAEFNVCVRRSRERRLYSSSSNHVTVYVRGDGVYDGGRFVIRYNVVGCPVLTLPGNVWVKTVDPDGDDVMIRCNDTMETWYVTCQGNQWVGDVGNCTGAPYEVISRWKNTNLRSQPATFANGVLLAMILGIFLGLILATVTLFAFCCLRRRLTRAQSVKMPSSGADDLTFNLDNDADGSEEVEGHVASTCQSKLDSDASSYSPGKGRTVDLHGSFDVLDLYAKVKKVTRGASQTPSAAGLHLRDVHQHCPTILLDIDRSNNDITCAT